ncbi:MAG: DUF6502 family protein [Gammaproteobacteria bacterium]|nr:DUF6502 family protein [Gammaproteobacteria bacterium]MDE0508028.1 DUF6502 family protein [Gammaproteobacteria bacterium]
MSPAAQHPPEMPPARLVDAVRRIMRPLVRLLISYQLTYPLLIRILKSVYVEVAESEFSVDEAPLSDSRINLLTGIHRKDIKKLRNERPASGQPAAAASLGAQLVAEWLGSDRFAGGGEPRALPLKTTDPDVPGFDILVAEVCRQDIRPRVILDEWIQLGVARLANDHVVLNTGAFTPEHGFDEKVFFFGKNLQDHIAAGADNLRGRESPHFDRSVYYDSLGPGSIKELKDLADELGMQALTRLNRRALALQKADSARSARNGPGYRINFGIFNYTTSKRTGKDSGEEG